MEARRKHFLKPPGPGSFPHTSVTPFVATSHHPCFTDMETKAQIGAETPHTPPDCIASAWSGLSQSHSCSYELLHCPPGCPSPGPRHTAAVPLHLVPVVRSWRGTQPLCASVCLSQRQRWRCSAPRALGGCRNCLNAGVCCFPHTSPCQACLCLPWQHPFELPGPASHTLPVGSHP